MENGIQLFQTPLTSCPYLEKEDSCNFIVDPSFAMTPTVYDFLLEKGFRRSAEIVYRPACPGCQECKSTRIPVSTFKPSRSQKRAWSRVYNDLSMVQKDSAFEESHYQLYRQYTQSRHADSDMSESTIKQYMDFLTSSWSDTIFVEIHVKDELLAVAVTDRQPGSLSAIYTFYDPQKSHLSPGTIAILSQIELARDLELDWLYLGYWIKSCQKMSYKAQFRPIQYLHVGEWHLLER